MSKSPHRHRNLLVVYRFTMDKKHGFTCDKSEDLKQISLLYATLRLSGSHVNRNPATLAFDLLGRLLPYYDVYTQIRSLLQQCDTMGLKHSMVNNLGKALC